MSEKIGGITVWDLGVFLDEFDELLADLAAFKRLVIRAIRNELVADADSDKPIMLHQDFFSHDTRSSNIASTDRLPSRS